MSITRRVFLKGAAVGLAGATVASKLAAAEAADTAPRIHIGSCHIGLAGAKEAGLDGVEVGVGNAADTLSIAEPATRQKYKNEMKETGLVACSFMMGLLNSYPLASDPRGPAWLEQSIDAAKDLGAKVILVAFFGKGSLGTRGNVKTADVDVVVQRLKAAAPRAKDAGVVLGIENELPAKANLEILDRIGSDAVGIYYDVYNLTNNGYDIPAEIRLLKDRICQFHFKNGPDYLESGKVKWEPVAAAMKEIGYRKWIVLETSNPSKSVVADDRKNAEYIRKLFA
ncbi:MAG: sugar phosphate isomerase/epimerase [Planctomycetota bacterium]|nr:sugar phosphate isomerase/epimerase [Planctomycetota bacterium]